MVNYSDFHKVVLRFAGAQGISNILRVLAGFLVVKFVDPEVYGSFTGPGIYLTYFLLFHLGINNGLSRELPFFLGSGKKKLANEYAATGLFVNGIVSIVTFCVFGTITLIFLNQGKFEASLIYGTYSIIGLINLPTKSYLPVLYRTNNDFYKLARIRFVMGFINLASVFLVFFFGLIGLCIRMITLFSIEFLLLFINRPIRVKPMLSFNDIKSLIKVGIPIYLVGHVNILWNNVVNNIILLTGGSLFFGYYALCIIISNAVGIIPNSFSQIIYPKMSILLGEGAPLDKILNIVWTPMKMGLLLLFVIAVAGLFILPPFVNYFLPKYSPGVIAAQWILFLPFVKIFSLFANLFNVVKKQFWYLVSLIIGAGAGTIYILVMLAFTEFKLVYFPQGLILGSLVQILLSYYFLKQKIINVEPQVN